MLLFLTPELCWICISGYHNILLLKFIVLISYSGLLSVRYFNINDSKFYYKYLGLVQLGTWGWGSNISLFGEAKWNPLLTVFNGCFSWKWKWTVDVLLVNLYYDWLVYLEVNSEIPQITTIQIKRSCDEDDTCIGWAVSFVQQMFSLNTFFFFLTTVLVFLFACT